MVSGVLMSFRFLGKNNFAQVSGNSLGFWRTVLFWKRFSGFLLLFLFLLTFLSVSKTPATESVRRLDEFFLFLDEGQVREVALDDRSRTLKATLTGEKAEKFITVYPDGLGPFLAERVLEKGIPLQAAAVKEENNTLWAFVSVLPLFLIAGVLSWYLLRSGATRGISAKGKKNSGAEEIPDVTLADVAGHVEVVEELRDLVLCLHDPERFARAGARPPRGVLLTGPPGTGKTLMARAVAGEAEVPFFAVGGADFVEMFAGLGASRARRLFARARKAGRAVVFIDEIDAVGKARAAGVSSGASEERENTLNQLLVELDGFQKNGHLIVLAATNRPDMLDKALLRSGRFDRVIELSLPDREARHEILALHGQARGVAGIDWHRVAALTSGMTGADLENILNQAALRVARAGRERVEEGDVLEAVAMLVLGDERPSHVLDARDREVVAWHEAGHAVCALLYADAPFPRQVTIVPRGSKGGATWFDGEVRELLSWKRAFARLVVLLGGRVGEELLCSDDVTHGAAGDLREATELGRRMVVEYGMTDFGLVFLDVGDLKWNGQASAVHQAVQQVLENAMSQARQLVKKEATFVSEVAEALLSQETLTAAQLETMRRSSHTSPPNRGETIPQSDQSDGKLGVLSG